LKTQPLSNRWFLKLSQTNSGPIRLFCLPYAGGGASIYRPWSRLMSDQVEIWAIQLPGRENRLKEEAWVYLPYLVDELAERFDAFLDRPFALFGHSMGALLSYELAHKLRQSYGMSPVHLFAAGHRAPGRPDVRPPIHHLGQAEFLDWLRRLGGTPKEVFQHTELLQPLLTTLRADLQLCETHIHTPRRPLECPITAMGGHEDPYVAEADIEAWQEMTTGPFEMRMFPGNHFFLHNHLSNIGQIVHQRLLDLA